MLKFVGYSSFRIIFDKSCYSEFGVAKFLKKVAAYTTLTKSTLIYFEVKRSKYNDEASHSVSYFTLFTSFLLILILVSFLFDSFFTICL